MTQNSEIICHVAALEPEFTKAKLKVAMAQAELDGIYAKRKVYQGLCEHPYGYTTSCMGDKGFHCPDCKYSR